MSTQLTILDGLPTFRGNPRPNEVDTFTPSVNVKTWFRALDNHFLQNDIYSDEAKLRILFAQVDKNSGDALELVSVFCGKNVTYEEVREDFLSIYPNFVRSEFRHAARSILKLDVHSPTLLLGMTSLETHSRALVEAYLNKPQMTELQLGHDCRLDRVITDPYDRETRPTVWKTTSRLEEEADEHSRTPSPATPPRSREITTHTVMLSDVLQNLVLHLFTAAQFKDHIYDKLSTITPLTKSTKFMSMSVQLAEKEKLVRSEGKKSKQHDHTEVLYNLNTEQRPAAAQNARACYTCGKTGHFARECRSKLSCKYCKFNGHGTDKCQKRIKNGVQFCTKCNTLGHEAKECKVKMCSYCKKKGHTVDQCRQKNKGSSQTRNGTHNYSSTNKMDHVRTMSEAYHIEDPDQSYDDTGSEGMEE